MYIGTHFDKKKDIVKVLEVQNGKTIQNEYQPEYYFYIPDKSGKYVQIHGDRLSKLTFKTYKDFTANSRKYSNRGVKTFEAGVRPLFKTLEHHFKNMKKYKMNKTYFDIEVGFDAGTDKKPGRGYAEPSDPFNPVTAISLYNDWEDVLYSIVLKPDNLSLEEAEQLLHDIPNNVVVDDEITLLMIFFELIKDTHIFTGWNQRFFDIPYLVNRTRLLLGKEGTKNFCLWGYEPVKSVVEKYGKDQDVYDLIGRVHLDMLELYQKYTYTEQPSYSLDAIAYFELKENKVPYKGTIDYMYKNDLRLFVDYARQDTLLLKKIDDKKDHINLAFTIAHENLVDIKTVMGAVALSDNAIVREAHNLNMIVPDKDRSKQNGKIAGAFVADPVKGLTEWIGSVDLTSLYPQIFRALNLGNETIIGQVRHTITGPIIEERLASGMDFAEAWGDFFWVKEFEEIRNKTNTMLIVDLEDGSSFELSASEIHDFIFGHNYIITANCTIISKDKQSVVASLLGKWFTDRKRFQNRAETYEKLTQGIDLPKEILDQL